MSEDAVIRESRDGVLLVTLNRPRKKNAFNDPQWTGLGEALREAREDRSIAAMVITGAGGNFSAGQDLSAFVDRPDSAGDTRPDTIEASAFGGCMNELIAFDKPLLAAVPGVGVGIGATFLFHCDIVYVGESLRLRLPFVSLGLVPEAASSFLLQQAIGSQRAAELFFTAEWIDAARAVEVGIAARALPDGELLAATLAKAREIARWPVASLQATKRCLLAMRADAVRAARAVEDEGMSERAGSPENVEAVMAFLEKRAPDFTQFR